MKKLLLLLPLLILVACGNMTPAGDITAVLTPTGSGLSGGTSFGAATLTLKTTCTTGYALTWDGDSWECASIPNLSAGGVANTIPKFTDADSLGLSLLTDDAAYLNYNAWKFYVDATNGDTGIAGDFYAAGRPTIATPTIDAWRTPTAGTIDNIPAIRGINNGTYDTTASALYTYGVMGRAYGTESAGGNLLNNWGVFGYASSGDNASGVEGYAYGGTTFTTGFAGRGHGQALGSVVIGGSGQADTDHATAPTIGLYGYARTGNIRVGTVGLAVSGGGTTNIGVFGTIEAYTTTFPAGTWAGYFKGDSVVTGDLRSLSGTGPLWASGTGSPEGVKTAPIGSMFSRTDGSTNTALYRKETGAGNTGWVAVAAGAAGITNSAGNNVITKSDGTNLVASTLTDDGTTVDVNTDVTKFGSAVDGYAYFSINSLNFRYGTNLADTGYINYYGYAGGATQFRDLVIADGKTATIATFTASTKAVALAGALTVDGATTVHDFRGTVISPTTSGTQHNYAPTGHATATVVNVAPTAAVDLTGFEGGVAGRVLIIRNEGSIGYLMNLYHQHASSSAANRFDLVNDVAWTLYSGDAVTFVHDGSQWIMEGHSGRWSPGLYLSADLAMGGASITGAANYTGTGNTVLGDAITDTTTITGKTTITGPSGDEAFTVLNSSTAQTAGLDVTYSRSNGTFNTTAGGLVTSGVHGLADGTRSSGANSLINIGVTGRALNGQENYGVYSEGSLMVASSISVAGVFTDPALVVIPSVNGGSASFYGKIRDVGAVPAVSTCGTSPTIVGGSNAMFITAGTGTATSCTVTFASTWSTEPYCIVETESSTVEAYISAKSATAFTLTGKATGNLAGLKINVLCIGDA